LIRLKRGACITYLILRDATRDLVELDLAGGRVSRHLVAAKLPILASEIMCRTENTRTSPWSAILIDDVKVFVRSYSSGDVVLEGTETRAIARMSLDAWIMIYIVQRSDEMACRVMGS
jgi:hypothetical protein